MLIEIKHNIIIQHIIRRAVHCITVFATFFRNTHLYSKIQISIQIQKYKIQTSRVLVIIVCHCSKVTAFGSHCQSIFVIIITENILYLFQNIYYFKVLQANALICFWISILSGYICIIKCSNVFLDYNYVI